MAGVAIVVFSDLVESTSLLARLGDDRMEAVRRAHVEDVRRAVDDAGGRLVKTLGDGAMSSFDSALGALRAAAAIQAGVERLDATEGGIGIAARVGVAAGEPIADGEDLHGMPVVIASRLSSEAGTGEVLVQDLVQALVASRDGVKLEEARDFELKGVPEPVRASQLLWRDLAAATDGAAANAEPGGGESSDVDTPERAGGATFPGIPLPPKLAAYAEEPLIGRDREVAILRDATEPRPGCRAVLIVGEPGIGKTRHAAAAASEAHADGATVVLARCPPETVVPFEPWVRAIGELALAGSEAWREELADAAGSEVAALVPELSGHAKSDERAGASAFVAAEGARYRLLRGIGAALTHGAREGPLHVVLDDAQWCDPASAQALGHLLDSPPTGELTLVVTAREGEMGRGHPVSRALSDLRRTGDLSELPLTGLDTNEMAALIDARVGRAITPALATRLTARTAGNPFFAGELVRDLDERDALREGEALDTAPVPGAVAGLVERRLARLSPDTERFLTAVATIGPSAPVALAAKAGELGLDEAERAAREAISERLVDDVATEEPTVSFTHALVREALISETTDAARARLHLAIARALEESPDAEPAELARHFGLAVELAGPEPAIAAYRAAATNAAAGHDHEGAAEHLHGVLSLLPEGDLAARAPILLALGEEELLSANLVKARGSFHGAVEAARETGDGATLARAALGFAGGDVGFIWELGTDDPTALALLREGLEAIDESEPRLALRMILRLSYLLVLSDDDETLSSLARRAGELEQRLGDAEARVLAQSTTAFTRFARYPDPPAAMDWFEEPLGLLAPAEQCGREDLLFRVVQWSAAAHYGLGRISECEQTIERAAEIAERLGSPRFSWEVDLNRGMRLLDSGKREAGEALIHRAGAVVRHLRPDLHIIVELGQLAWADWIYGGKVATFRLFSETWFAETSSGLLAASSAVTAAADGDLETAKRLLRNLLSENLEALRRPDGQLPIALCVLAHAAYLSGEREVGARLRPLLEPMRSRLVISAPVLWFGQLPEWHIGCLQLLEDNPDAAVEELRTAVARADDIGLAWARAWSRVDLAIALQRSGSREEALTVLAEAESLSERYGVGWASKCAADARAELEGRRPPKSRRDAERSRPIRTLATRGGRRALAAMVGDRDDAELERRFAEPRRQRALMRTLARGFQPAQAAGFSGIIAYELEPFAIEPPPDSPWRWAIEADSRSGHAHLIEPAPLDAAVTIHLRLADWVRLMAGKQRALDVMATGRCSVEGEVLVAARLEAMFGAG